MRNFWSKKKEYSTNNQSKFKKEFSLAERKQKRSQFKQKYSDSDYCVAVLEGLRQLPSQIPNVKPYQILGLEKKLTGMHIIRYLKKSLLINESLSLIIIVGNSVTNMSSSLGELAERFLDEDGFLYVYVKQEDSF